MPIETPANAKPEKINCWRLTLIILVITGLIYVATIVSLPRTGFWVVDQGVKYLQIEALLDSGFREMSINWPGRAMDPGLRYMPLVEPFAVVREGKILGTFPPAFALLSALPHRWWGHAGLLLLPLLGGLLLLVGLARISGRLGHDDRERALVVALAGLATPLWFYSVTFWEHVPAACCLVWGLDGCLAFVSCGRISQLVRGAALAAASTWFREELVLFAPLLLGGVILLRRQRRLGNALVFCTTFFLALLPALYLNWRYTGHILGFHLSSNLATSVGFQGHLAQRPLALYRLFLALDRRWWLSLALAIPFLPLVLVPLLPRLRLQRLLLPLSVLATAGGAVTLAGYLGSEGPIVQLLEANGFFGGASWLFLAFLPPRDDSRAGRLGHVLGWMILAYALLHVLLVPADILRGIHWGQRHLLVLYPLAALPAVHNLRCWLTGKGKWPGLSRAVILLPVILSMVAQAYSISLLHRARHFSEHLNEAVAGRTEKVIVTRTWFVPMQLHRSFGSLPIFFLPRQEEDFARLAPLLRKSGITGVLTVDSAGLFPAPLWGGPAVTIDDGGLGYYAVRLGHLDLGRLRP